ncbi:MAG: hypothetical protein HN403_18555 [Rhodospirillales bacterium]|jgi:hypothetical protein|nr:hypothetical protein [Rhodospirillales bacterium]
MLEPQSARIKSGPGSSIARRLIFWVVLCSSLITFVATSFQLYLEYEHDVDNINQTMLQIQDNHLGSLTNSVWVSNDTQVILQLEGLARLPDIEYLGISVDGEAKWSAGTRNSRYVVTVEQPMKYDYYGERVLIGNLQVVASLEGIYARLWNKALVILLSNGVKTFLVAVFMFLLFQYLVTRHLRKLAEHVKNTDIRRQPPRCSWKGGRPATAVKMNWTM